MIEFATIPQRNLIADLCGQLGYDPDEYITPTLTKEDARGLIKELLDERG